MNLQEAVESIRPLDEKAMEQSREHWDSIAHPLHSLGKLEDMVYRSRGSQEIPEFMWIKESWYLCARTRCGRGRSDPDRTGDHCPCS